MKRRQFHEHLFRGIPNNCVTRYLVRWLNRRMAAADSRWEFRIRYRCARQPEQRTSFGSIRSEHARRFSLYLVVRPAARRARRRGMDDRARAEALAPPSRSLPTYRPH